jgi:hypothetical protein
MGRLEVKEGKKQNKTNESSWQGILDHCNIPFRLTSSYLISITHLLARSCLFNDCQIGEECRLQEVRA